LSLQDFTQAELLLALRVVADPNGLFMCGDTCQTIARGIGFRRAGTLLCCAALCCGVECSEQAAGWQSGQGSKT
jgi:hypothetical protein